MPSNWALAASALLHATAIAACMTLVHLRPNLIARRDSEVSHSSTVSSHIVFLASPVRSAAGGGGGGNGQSAPIRRAESPGHDRITLRVAKPIATPDHIPDAEPSLPGLLLDVKPLASGTLEQLGLPVGGVSFGTSTGPGSGGGVGEGTGTGIGSGRGPGFGPGAGGGTGGGVYRPGGSVTPPRLRSEVKPSYTAEALRERIQGSVVLELVVTTDGYPADVHVIRSLDPHGLDEEAMAAVRQWRFAPGRLAGTPVNVLVTVVVDFVIR